MALSARKTMEARGKEFGTLLKGSDLGNSKNTITVECLNVREAAEGFGSPFIIDHTPVCGNIKSFPVNVTNLRIIEKLSGDDLEKLIGCEITLTKVRRTNPQTRQPSIGLEITAISKPKAAILKKVEKFNAEHADGAPF